MGFEYGYHRLRIRGVESHVPSRSEVTYGERVRVKDPDCVIRRAKCQKLPIWA